MAHVHKMNEYVFEWERSDENEDVLELLENFCKSLKQEELYVVVEKNGYWHTKTILNRVFSNYDEVEEICNKLNQKKSEYELWDHEYHHTTSFMFDDNKDMVQVDIPPPNIPYDERKQQIGCRYDGAHYIDIEYIPHHLHHKYHISAQKYKKPQIGNSGISLNLYTLHDIKKIHNINLSKYSYVCIKKVDLTEQKSSYQEIDDAEFGTFFPKEDDKLNVYEQYIRDTFKQRKE